VAEEQKTQIITSHCSILMDAGYYNPQTKVNGETMMNIALLLLVLLCSLLLQPEAHAAGFVGQQNRPPVGATYEKAIGIPVLGRQTFSLHIISDTTAHLLVQGMLALDEILDYKFTATGCLQCRLSDNAIQRMRRVHASLKEVGYDGDTDTPYVKVSTPLPVPVKIHLKRKNNRIHTDEESMIDDESRGEEYIGITFHE
jgi:hypothetical protein